jgi:hypothetical protein
MMQLQVVETDAANVLFAAPDHFYFFFPAVFGD